MNSRLNEIQETFARCHRSTGSKPLSVVITGDSGVGKSTMIARYIRSVQRNSGESDDPLEACDAVPVLSLRVPPQPGMLSLYNVILETLGHPARRARATGRQLYRQVLDLLRDLRVELIIMDEFQDLMPNRTKEYSDVLRLLKNIIDELRIPWVLVGLRDAANILECGDEQLMHRFAGTWEITPFRIDAGDELRYFQKYLETWQSVYPVPCMSLSDENMAIRLFCASRGYVGRLARILEEVIELYDGTDRKASLRHFARAYEVCAQRRTIGARQNSVFNPFVADVSRVLKQC